DARLVNRFRSLLPGQMRRRGHAGDATSDHPRPAAAVRGERPAHQERRTRNTERKLAMFGLDFFAFAGLIALIVVAAVLYSRITRIVVRPHEAVLVTKN